MSGRPIHLVNMTAFNEGIDETYVASNPPYGTLYVGSALKKAGFDVRLHHVTPREGSARAEEIVRSGPLFVGFSVLTGEHCYHSALMSEKIKELGNVPIVWGGHHTSLVPLQCLSEPYIDYVCVKEGEVTSVELARALENEKPVDAIEGIGYVKDGKPILNNPRPLVDDLDSVEIDWSLVDVRKDYFPSYKPKGSGRGSRQPTESKRIVTVLSSRGCPYDCGFCSSKSYYNRTWRTHSIDYLMRQLDTLESLIGSIGIVSFCDDNLLIDKARAAEIFRVLRERGIRPDFISLRLDHLTEEMLEMFARYDVRSIFFGWESGNQRILDLMHKKMSPEQILDRAKLLRRYPRIKVIASGILGVPTETEKEVRNTIEFATALHELLPAITVSLCRFRPLPGTELTALAMENGFRLPDGPKEWRVADPESECYEMPWLPWVTSERLRNFRTTQSQIRYHMTKNPPGRRITWAVQSSFHKINRWRIRNQTFRGIEAQRKIETWIEEGFRLLRRITERFSHSG